MAAECSLDRHNATLCRKCIALHEVVLKAAGCDEEMERKFCEPAPKPPAPPAPAHSCEEELAKECEVNGTPPLSPNPERRAKRWSSCVVNEVY